MTFELLAHTLRLGALKERERQKYMPVNSGKEAKEFQLLDICTTHSMIRRVRKRI